MYKYLNGNVRTSLDFDGTKIREWDGIACPAYPDSIDIKITNYCTGFSVCKWCHEESNVHGKHADLDKLLLKLEILPPGTELAIGGGNPLSHPDLANFLEKLRKIDLVPNLTVNEIHLAAEKQFVVDLYQRGLIFGLGLSYNGRDLATIIEVAEKVPTAVIHVVMGVMPVTVLGEFPEQIRNVLILGYKRKGRGMDYISESVENNLTDWYKQIRKYIARGNVSFDNLAIEQTGIKRFIPNDMWDEFYMGDDGTFTFYIDAVKTKYAISSSSVETFDVLDLDAQQMFRHIKQAANKIHEQHFTKP